MPRYAQIIMGPAGSGKSTYCATMLRHLETVKRSAHAINLDPEALHFGPNGGLVYCMEFLLQNLDVLDEVLSYDDDYLLIDCPGQIELYTHLPLMRQLVQHLVSLDFKVVAMYLLDAQFIGKFQ
eukprot:TRINITY_DN10876_c0_g2_i4.p1 TRINITY_DN10876_c0_g2~~TRINITY_DN10876_c0_g2_i4.p1  ORF type:complete len:124 (+),score=6.00 TRINITY_DN10876_c0_g2_i4:105-476(+)